MPCTSLEQQDQLLGVTCAWQHHTRQQSVHYWVTNGNIQNPELTNPSFSSQLSGFLSRCNYNLAQQDVLLLERSVASATAALLRGAVAPTFVQSVEVITQQLSVLMLSGNRGKPQVPLSTNYCNPPAVLYHLCVAV